MVTLIARWAASAVRDVLVEPNRDRLTDADDFAVVGQDVGHREVLGRVGFERHADCGRTPPNPSASACSVYCLL